MRQPIVLATLVSRVGLPPTMAPCPTNENPIAVQADGTTVFEDLAPAAAAHKQ